MNSSPEPARAMTAAIQAALPFTHFDEEATIRYDADASSKLGRDYWRVVTPIKFYVGDRTDDVWVYVPAGYLADGATVPRWLYWLVPAWGRHGHATIIHDYLCENPMIFSRGETVDIDRKRADKIFNESMKVTGVNPVMRWLLYTGVSAYTWYARLTNRRPRQSFVALKRLLESSYTA